jgi:hypothetical protein
MNLVLCPRCHRHVKASDDGCPFCKRSTREVARPAVGAALAVGLGLAVSNCFAVAAAAHGDGGTRTGARDAGVAPDAVFTVPYGTAPAMDSGGGDAGVVTDARAEDAGRDAGVPTACVDIVLTDAGLACTTDNDCTAFLTGKICSTDCWECDSETVPMNTAAAAQYKAELAALPQTSCGPCGEVYVATPECIEGQCAMMAMAYKPPPPDP